MTDTSLIYVSEVSVLKRCSKCHVEKDMAEFTNRKLSKDGKFAWCRECKDKHYNQYRRERGKTPNRKSVV